MGIIQLVARPARISVLRAFDLKYGSGRVRAILFDAGSTAHLGGPFNSNGLRIQHFDDRDAEDFGVRGSDINVDPSTSGFVL